MSQDLNEVAQSIVNDTGKTSAPKISEAELDKTIMASKDLWLTTVNIPFKVVPKGAAKSIKNRSNVGSSGSDVFDPSKKTWFRSIDIQYHIGLTDIMVISDAKIDLIGRTGVQEAKYGSEYVCVGMPEATYINLLKAFVNATRNNGLVWKSSSPNKSGYVWANVTLPAERKPKIMIADNKIEMREIIVNKPQYFIGNMVCTSKLTAYVEKSLDLNKESSDEWVIKLDIVGFHTTGLVDRASEEGSFAGYKRKEY